MPRLRLIVVVAAVAVVAAACQSSTENTTTTAESPLLTLPPPTTPPTSTTSTTLVPVEQLSSPEYQIVQRSAGEGTGDTVVVLLDSSSYETLTDIDLEDVIADVVRRFPPIATVHVIDDPAAANIVGNPDATEEQIASIEDHYFARLDDGFTITFLGPFAPAGATVLGS
jgi:hypothetical protein